MWQMKLAHSCMQVHIQVTCQTMASTACSCHRSRKCAPVLTTSCIYLYPHAHAMPCGITEQQGAAARAASFETHEAADVILNPG